MKDSECVAFLQWALPRLGLRWEGYRKVRAQACKRIGRRAQELGLSGPQAYRACLERAPDEWGTLAALLPITISRFYRDKAVFDFIAAILLPALARDASARGEKLLRALSLGCASGEEPYTLMLAWRFASAPRFPDLVLRVVAVDVLEELLARARAACYPASSLKRLPRAWREAAFERRNDGYCLHAAYRHGVEFLRQDIRNEMPEGPFDLILCRNLVFTYFDEAAQRDALRRLLERLRPGGALVIGSHETLLHGSGLASWPGAERLPILRRSSEGEIEVRGR